MSVSTMCSNLIPIRTDEELTADLEFATAFARKYAGRNGIDYEVCASDGLMKALSRPTPEGFTFRRFLALCVRNMIASATRTVRRQRGIVRFVQNDDLDSLEAKGTTSPGDLLDGLTPDQRQLAHDIWVEKVGERAAALERGMNRRQLRNTLRGVRRFLERRLGEV